LRTPAVAILLASVPLALAACSAPDAPHTERSAAPTASSRARTPAHGGSGGGGTTACQAGDVSATVTGQGPFTVGAQVRAMIMITNTSDQACRIKGWTGVRLLNAADEAVPIKVRKVEQPGPAVTIDLKPGVSAPAGMKWTQCDKGDETCFAGNTLEIRLPGGGAAIRTGLSDFPAPERSGIAMKSVEVGPLQLSRQGVVAW
jgi:hypothetical protein